MRVFFQRLLGTGFLDNHRIHACFATQAQHQRVALGQVLGRQPQLIGIEWGNGANHLGAILLRQASRFLQSVVILFDDQADQVHVGGQAIHVLGYFVRARRHDVATVEGEPDRIAAAIALLQPERTALVIFSVQCQAESPILLLSGFDGFAA